MQSLRLYTLLLALLIAFAPLRALANDGDTAVQAVAMTVSDLQRAERFYGEVLGFKLLEETEVSGKEYEQLYGVPGLRLRVARMRLGDEEIKLLHFSAPSGRLFPADSRSNDHWFQHIAIVVSDMARAYARLQAANVKHASSAPQRLPDWNPQAGGIEAFYFRDPDGHYLELIHFPPSRGAARWQDAQGQLFQGIDHTAIVVENTDASLHFYRDWLGMKIAGTSENWGPEQAHLNNVADAHLRITALRAGRGPGVELLEYLTPHDGRPAPADGRANDLWHWQLELTRPPLTDSEVLNDSTYRAVSEQQVILPSGRARMYFDPDRHAVLINVQSTD